MANLLRSLVIAQMIMATSFKKKLDIKA